MLVYFFSMLSGGYTCSAKDKSKLEPRIANSCALLLPVMFLCPGIYNSVMSAWLLASNASRKHCLLSPYSNSNQDWYGINLINSKNLLRFGPDLIKPVKPENSLKTQKSICSTILADISFFLENNENEHFQEVQV